MSPTTHAPTDEKNARVQPASESRDGKARAEPSRQESKPAAKHSGKRLLLLALFIVAAAGGGIWYYLDRKPKDESHLVLQGNIDVRQVNLSFKVAGRIEQLNVDEGDAAQTGQVLASLDKRYFQDDLRLARARRENAAASLARLENGSRPQEIAQAKAQTIDKEALLTQARADYARMQELNKTPGAISKQDLDRYKALLGVAEAQAKVAHESQRLVEIGPRQEDIAAARAQLAEREVAVVQAERRLADSDLIAPSSGIILTRAREKGAIVQAGDTVFTLTLSSPVWVRSYVNEKDLGNIYPDMPADVRTDSAPNKVYHGKIGFISPTAEFTPKTVETRELRTDLVYRLRVIVDNPDGGLRQGMPVTVTLERIHGK